MVAVGGDSGGCGGDVGGDDGNGGGDDDDDGGGVEDAEHVEEQVEGGGWPHPHGDGRDLGQSRAPHRHRSQETSSHVEASVSSEDEENLASTGRTARERSAGAGMAEAAAAGAAASARCRRHWSAHTTKARPAGSGHSMMMSCWSSSDRMRRCREAGMPSKTTTHTAKPSTLAAIHRKPSLPITRWVSGPSVSPIQTGW